MMSHTESAAKSEPQVENGPIPDPRTELLHLIDEQNSQIDQYCSTIDALSNASQISTQQIKELEGRYELAIKNKEHAVKEKESMVVRYATSEKNVLLERNAKENAEKMLKELQRELELVNGKLTMMVNEKARICQILDNKTHELKSSHQDVDRLRQDLSALETKLKWSQTSLKKEMEMRKQVEEELTSLQAEVQSYVNAAERAKKEAEDEIKAFHTSQDNRAHVLDVQNKEQQASLILLRHDVEERDVQQKQLECKLVKLKGKYNESVDENNKLSKTVQRLESERAEQDARIVELRNTVDEQRSQAMDLDALRGQVDEIKLQAKSDRERLNSASDHIELLKSRNVDLIADLDGYRAHEIELLAFTQQLTDKNVLLQSDFTLLETKTQQLVYENGILVRNAADAAAKSAITHSQSTSERNRFVAENEKLQSELTNVTQQCEQLKTQLADQQGENNVLRRKHELSLREVNKELGHCRKRIEQFENQCGRSSSSSNTSLNASEENAASSDSQNGSAGDETRVRIGIVQPEVELNHRILIEHIAKLQRINAKKSEKLDFMEEHVKTLVGELQKKGRLLHHYMRNEQPGTMSSNSMDSNKANLIKHSGTMASIHSAKIADENLSIEQVLDINRKLYAVLEDALLKNITLKENIDTLGTEIAKLQCGRANYA